MAFKKTITDQEEIELIRKAQQGDLPARDKIIQENMGFLHQQAYKYKTSKDAIQAPADFVNLAALGMLTAIDRFDPTRGFKFITYAVWWIRREILRELEQNGRVVRFPANQIHDLKQKGNQDYQRAVEQERLDTNVDTRLLVRDLDHPIQFYNGQAQSNATELDLLEIQAARPDQACNSPMLTQLGNDFAPVLFDNSDREEIDAVFQKILKLYPSRGKILVDILQKNFGLVGDRELNLQEIGDQYNLSRERIRVLRDRGLKLFRRLYNEQPA